MVFSLSAVGLLSACNEGPAPQDNLPESATVVAVPVSGSDAHAGHSGGMLNPDSAGRADLVAAGVSDTIAGSIIAGRPYASMVALDRVLARSLSEQQRDSVYAHVWKPIDLNKATDAEILLIPGIGNRMLHEFKEYRPYTSIEQFRREIGKYVDKEEVARLERYVTIR